MIETKENIIPLQEKEANLLVQEQVTLENAIFATNEYDVVINVYDTFDNFLFKEKIAGEDFTFDYQNEQEYIQDIQNLVRQNGLNENGKYKLEYYFVKDTFDAIENEDNTFIITEISADRLEVRLNPKTNSETFLNKFNDFKQYITGYRDNTVVELFIEESVTEYLDYYFDRISEFIEDVVVKDEDGKNPKKIRAYLTLFYDNSVINTIMNNIKNDIINKKEIIENRIKQEIDSEDNLSSQVEEYNNNPSESLLDTIQTYVFNILTNRLPNIILEESNIEISQE